MLMFPTAGSTASELADLAPNEPFPCLLFSDARDDLQLHLLVESSSCSHVFLIDWTMDWLCRVRACLLLNLTFLC